MLMKTEGQAEFVLSEHPEVLRSGRRVVLGSLGEPEVSLGFYLHSVHQQVNCPAFVRSTFNAAKDSLLVFSNSAKL